MNPLVSVLMAVRNREQTLQAAIDSILNQTLSDLELIIVENGSTDGTRDILNQLNDPRIHRQFHSEPMSPAQARNLAWREAKGTYLAIMDSDDISLPQRLESQIAYLQAHSEIGILGSAEDILSATNEVIAANTFPVTPGHIHWMILLGGWCLSHSSVILRHSVMTQLGGYPEVPVAEDFAFFSRAIFKTRIANLPRVLVQRRIWEDCISLEQALGVRFVIVNAMQANFEMLLGRTIERKTVEHLFWIEQKILMENHSNESDVDQQIHAHAAALEDGLELKNTADVYALEELLEDLEAAFLKKFKPTTKEAKQIALHTLKRLAALKQENASF